MPRPIAYQPGRSWLHRLHPLVKGAWLLGLSGLVFATRALPVVLATLLFSVGALALSGLSLRDRRGIRVLLITGVSLGIMQILLHSGRDGVVWREIGPLTVTVPGLTNALYISARFLSIVLLSYGFVLSTDPNDLAYALMRVGLPYRYGFTLVTALRLVPIFEQEAEIIYYAQLARGIGHDAPKRRRLALLLTHAQNLLFPVLSSALGKVDTLAVSMEGRGFGRYPERTFLRTVPFTRRDQVALILLSLIIILTYISRYLVAT
jgi:energy-coupling factor transport system permease protein